jgi:hypothetical protein
MRGDLATGEPAAHPFLSWGCSFRPSTASQATVHSRDAKASFRSHVATRGITFRPRGFSPPRRLAPATAPGVLQPVTVLGFATFPPPHPQPASQLRVQDLSRDTNHTPRRIPSTVAVPHHCGRCPLAVTADPATQDTPVHSHRTSRQGALSSTRACPGCTRRTGWCSHCGASRREPSCPPTEVRGTRRVGSFREQRAAEAALRCAREHTDSPAAVRDRSLWHLPGHPCSSRPPCAEAHQPKGRDPSNQGASRQPRADPEIGGSTPPKRPRPSDGPRRDHRCDQRASHNTELPPTE